MNIGDRFKSKQCGWFTVIEIVTHNKGKKFLIEFDEIMGVKYRTTREKKHVLSGSIINPYYPLRLGIACVGNVNSKDYGKEFNKWRGMIDRCYNKKNNHYNTYGAVGVTVCDRWLCFEYFLNDLPQLNGYDYELMQNGKLHLDKDILGDSKIYSPETCMLVSPKENVKEMSLRIKQRQFRAVKDNIELFSNNQTEFAKIIGAEQSEVSRCLNGIKNSVKGYKLEFIEGE